MKILNVILTSQNGGAEQAFIDYSRALKNLGHEVYAVLKIDAPYFEDVSALKIKIKKISNRFGYYDVFAVQNIKKFILENEIDAVISHMGRSTILVRKAIKKINANKKIIQIAVNHSGNVKRSIGSDIIFSVNKKIFFDTVDLGQSSEHSFVIPNAIDISDAVEFKKLSSLKNKSPIVIGAIGRLDRTKGFDLAIKALKKLTEISDQKFVLKIAGSGYFEPVLRNLVKELGLENEVEFLGWIKNKKAFFDQIDIFCLPSQNEPFGIVILEAMKFAKPIIATDADGPKEILIDKKDALIVPLNPIEKTPKQISEAILQIINDAELMNNMVKNAAQKLREKYSYGALEKRLAEIFGRVF